MALLQQVKEMANFFGKFNIVHNDEQTKIVKTSSGNNYLIKNIQLPSENTNLDNIIETLEQHLTLNKQYLLTLLHYELLPQKDDFFINVRAIYQYANLTLQEEIQQRKSNLDYFKVEEMWSLIYTVTKSLEYLQKFNIGYGVLGCDKIFIDEKIKLLDPSAVAEDPMLIRKDRLYSPEILLGYEGIDILKSDIYVFGLCLLEAALLINYSCELNQAKYDETRIKIYLQKVQNMYGPQFTDLLSQMLRFHAQQRPTFSQIKTYLQKLLSMKNLGLQQELQFCELKKDIQDEINHCQTIDEINEFENEDIQEQEDNDQNTSLNQYQRAKIKYLHYSKKSNGQDKSLSTIYENSMNASMSLLHSSRIYEKKKISKLIKERLVKHMNTNDLEVIQHKEYKTRHEQIFTNPKLMQDIKQNLRSIARHRNQLSSKENIYHYNN